MKRIGLLISSFATLSRASRGHTRCRTSVLPDVPEAGRALNSCLSCTPATLALSSVPASEAASSTEAAWIGGGDADEAWA